ncbi:MAG TPA: hypothetical protein VK698_08385 [Kofleriaceae bacterium]|nr:hypothetical protein [Kofleriaceae bacterium]
MRHPASRAVALAAAALGLAADASASTFVPPCEHNGCTAPEVDAEVGDLEYANGVGFPLSNFDAGGPNGALRLHLQGEKLYVGMRLPPPTDVHRGEVTLYLDADRPGTSCSPTAEKPGPEDRRLSLTYDLAAGTASLSQQVGNGTTWQAASGPNWWLKLWPTSMELTEAGGMLVAEVAITLRPAGASTSDVLEDEKVGFAMRHDVAGSDEHVPGGVSNPPGALTPCSWETLAFTRPNGVPLAFSVWELGFSEDEQEIEDLADMIWDRDVLCLLDAPVDLWGLVKIINERRGLNLMSTIQAIGAEDTWLLTSRPVVDSRIAFSDANPYITYTGSWARLVTDAGIPPLDRGPYGAGEFIDVYCMAEIVSWDSRELIDTTRAPDRPAIVLGPRDDDDYYYDLDSGEAFDEANGWLSDVHDVADIADPTHPGLDDITAYLLPALVEWPTFGIEQEPVATTTLHEYTPDGDDFSTNPEVSTTIKLVRTDQPGHWNPMKEHRITYAITKLHDHAAGGCCADWFTDYIGFPGHVDESYDDDHTPDGDVVAPGWNVSMILAAGSVTATAMVQEYDTTGDDHYDVVPEGGIDFDPIFRITHASGLVERLDFFGAVRDVLGTFEQHPGGMGVSTVGTNGEVATATHFITAEEID